MATNEQHWVYAEQGEEVMADIFRTLASLEEDTRYEQDAAKREQSLQQYRTMLSKITGQRWETLTLIPAALSAREEAALNQSRGKKGRVQGEEERKEDEGTQEGSGIESRRSIEGVSMVKTLKRLILHEHSREAGKALLLVGRYFRQDMSITKLKVMDAHYFSGYGGVSSMFE